MRTVAPETAAPATPARPSLLQRFLPAAAGPALIVACVLFAMRGFVFRNDLSIQHPDIVAFWLPRYCFLGHAIGAGHVPFWNPLQFAGVPFAADPQSGWLYAPAMLLFSTLSCGTAMRAFIVLQPLLAGVGLYWFLRTEGLHRAAAAAGGLSASMMISTSGVGLSLPFDAVLAWLPFLLVGAGGFIRARTWRRRAGWLALGAFAWGQVASAHLSHGLFMATLATLAYLVARAVRQVRAGDLEAWHAAAFVAGFLVFAIAANLAILLPRFALFDRTSLRGGYADIGGAAAHAAGLAQRPLSPTGFWSAWPLALGSAPGSYAGAAILLAVPLSLRASRRFMVIAFGAAGLVCYVLMLDALVSAHWFRRLVMSLPQGTVYLHSISRLHYLMFLVVPILGALGIDALIERPLPRFGSVPWISAGAALWLFAPLVAGAHPVRYALLAGCVAAAAPLLYLVARARPRAATILVGVLALELAGSAAWSQAWNGKTVYTGLEQDESGRDLMAQPLLWPRVPVARYLAPGPIARAIGRHPGRYDTWDPPEVFVDKGYLYDQSEPTWPALENARGMLFGLSDSMGYSPVQLTRYWTWVRAVNGSPIFYNAAALQHPTARDLRMLAVRYLIVPTSMHPPIPGRLVASEGRYSLYWIAGNPKVATVGLWNVVPTGYDALRAVTSARFDASARAILQRDPGIHQPPPSVAMRSPEALDVTASAPERMVIHVRASGPELVVVHDSFDPGWSYSVDGSPPAHVLAADYFLQAVPVTAGEHTIVLRYSDPSIGRGLVASGVAWGLLLASVAVTWRRRRRPAGEAPRR
jgi:hypothetical protein